MCSRWRDMTHVLRLWAFAWRHRHLQCDQMAKFLSIFGHLQQYKFAKVGSKFCQSRLVQRFAKYSINSRKNVQDVLKFAKVAKFRQIWSHWTLLSLDYRRAETDSKCSFSNSRTSLSIYSFGRASNPLILSWEASIRLLCRGQSDTRISELRS